MVCKFKEYPKFLMEDIKIRDYLSSELKQASVSKILIERPTKEACYSFTSRPGIVIGKKGEDIEKYRKKLQIFLVLKNQQSN